MADHPKKRGPVYRWFERTVLRLAMGIAASFAERRLVKAMRRGGLRPAPRTAAGHDELATEGFHITRDETSATSAEEIPEQP